MIGFELNINGEKISAALERGIISIIVTKLSTELTDSIDLDFTGLNLAEIGNEESVDWYKSNLKIGDELTIKVSDVMKNSPHREIRISNHDSIIEKKLKNYYSLKKELEEQGLI